LLQKLKAKMSLSVAELQCSNFQRLILQDSVLRKRPKKVTHLDRNFQSKSLKQLCNHSGRLEDTTIFELIGLFEEHIGADLTGSNFLDH